MRTHFPQLRLQILDCFAWLRRARTVPGDWRAAAGSSTTSMEITAATCGSTERGDSCGGVCGRTTSSGNRVVALTAEVGVPKALYPLQKLEVVSEIGMGMR